MLQGDVLHLYRRHDYNVANKTFLTNIDIDKMCNNSMIDMAEFKFHTYVEKMNMLNLFLCCILQCVTSVQ